MCVHVVVCLLACPLLLTLTHSLTHPLTHAHTLCVTYKDFGVVGPFIVDLGGNVNDEAEGVQYNSQDMVQNGVDCRVAWQARACL